MAMAKTFDATVTLCTVVPESVATLNAEWTSVSMRSLLEEARTRLLLLARELGHEDLDLEVKMGSIPGAILSAAESLAIDLIVLSSHRPAMKDWLIGANAARVVRHAKCSVLVVRE
jgi:nucleotide-binding universal stress UspA family protein